MEVTGLDIDGTKIYLASLKKSKSSFEILKMQIVEAHPPIQKKDVKRLYKSLASSKPFIVSGLSSADVLLKQVEWKLPSKKGMRQALQYQMESQSFLPPTETLFLPQMAKIDGKSFLHTFLTTKKALKTHLDFLSSYSIDPEQISMTAQALWRFAKECCQIESCLLLHIGCKTTTCLLAEDGVLLGFHSLSLGKEHLKDKTQIASFKKELSKTFYSFLREDLIEATAFPLLLSGYTEELFGSIKDALVSYHSSVIPVKEEWKLHAVAIGFALEGLSKDGKSLQFRKGDFIPQSQLKKLGKRAFTFLAANLLFASSLLFFGVKEIKNQKGMLSDALLQAVETDAKLFERLTPDTGLWEENLTSWQKALKREAKPLLYLSKNPKVADILSWLVSHPLLSEAKWKNFHYELSQYPKLGSAQEPLIAKVELEIEFSSQASARKFHESLLNGDSLILPKSEVSWEGSGTSYKTGFYINPGFQK
jgi:hypothetical protein